LFPHDILTFLACSQGKFTAWWNQFGIPKQGLAAILIIIGLYFWIFGTRFENVNSTIINSAILGLILYSFITIFYPINMMICMVLGVGIAFLVVQWETANSMALGVVVGYIFGLLSYNLLIKAVQVNPQALYWTLLIGSIIFFLSLGACIKEYGVALAASLVGSYAIVRGISVYGGGYPDEQYVMLLVNKKEYTQFGRVFGPKIYAYIGGIFFLTIIGVWIQSAWIPAKTEKKDDKPVENKADENKPVATTSAVAENKPEVATESKPLIENPNPENKN
jgi:Domain of unknown function (DUF4203)